MQIGQAGSKVIMGKSFKIIGTEALHMLNPRFGHDCGDFNEIFHRFSYQSRLN